MKKITIIYDFLKELGGLERVMFFQANKLKNHADIELLFSYISEKDKAKIIKELELDNSIEPKQIGKTRNETLQLALSFLFPSRTRKIKTDLIISHSFMASRMAYNKKKKDGTPYIVILYHPPNFLYSNVEGWANTSARIFAKFLGYFFKDKLKKIDIECVRGANIVIAISEYTAKRVKEIYGLNPAIVYPHISGFFKSMKKSEKEHFLKSNNIKRKFLFAHGRIIPDKNYKILLDFIKEIKNIDLIISGSVEENYRKELNEKIKELGLENRARILGRISKDDLLGYYNSAELFLMPAKKEDFGLTIVESIACGCPVIAWNDNAGPNEIINSENGLLAKPYNLSDFIFKIKTGLNKKWDKNKVVKSVNKFKEDEISKRLIDVIRKYV